MDVNCGTMPSPPSSCASGPGGPPNYPGLFPPSPSELGYFAPSPFPFPFPPPPPHRPHSPPASSHPPGSLASYLLQQHQSLGLPVPRPLTPGGSLPEAKRLKSSPPPSSNSNPSSPVSSTGVTSNNNQLIRPVVTNSILR